MVYSLFVVAPIVCLNFVLGPCFVVWSLVTADRRQSKMLILSTNVNQK